MRAIHGGLALTIPDDWQDHSTLLFVGASPSQSVSVSFLLGVTAESALAAQTEQLGTHTPGFEIIGQAPFHCGFGDGVMCEQRMVLRGRPVRQLAAAVVAGGICILLAASAPDGDFDLHRERLHNMLSSLGPAGAGR